MHVTIITPERTILDAEVGVLSVPGVNGEFQMLENHASVISLLTQGKIKIKGFKTKKPQESFFEEIDGGLAFSIKGGTLEFNNNKAVVLVS